MSDLAHVQGVERKNRRRSERGASLIEFALIAPFLLMLLFGVIEFAWLFSQNLDVRHGAREGARLAAVNYPVGPVASPPPRTQAQAQQIVAELCNRMDVTTGAEVTLTSAGDVGDPATARVIAPGDTLTGFLDWVIPASLELSSEVEIRLEQYAGWDNITDEPCP